MPVMYYDDRIPPVNIRWKWFFWNYISVRNSNLCNHCILTTAIYIFIHVHAYIESLLAVPPAWWYTWWSGSVLGEVLVLLSLRESVGEEGLIWRQFCTSASMFPNNRRLRQGQLHHYSYDFCYGNGLPGDSQEPSMSEICASQEFPEYRYPVSVPRHCSFQELKTSRI